jgi:hypothetical protein
MFSKSCQPLRILLRRFPARRWEFIVIAVAVVFLCVAELPIFPLCGLQRLCGVECPTCGTTRAVWNIFHGRFSAAWSLNPVGFVVVAFLFRYFASGILPSGSFRRAVHSTRVDMVMLVALFGAMVLKIMRVWG